MGFHYQETRQEKLFFCFFCLVASMSDAWLSVCSCLNICINERRGQKTTRSLSSPTHPTPFFPLSLPPSLPPWALSSLLLITGCPLWLSAWMCSVRWSKSSSVSSPALPLALCMRVWENVCVSFSYEPSTQSSKPSLSLSSFSLSSTFPGSLASSPCLLEGTHTHTHTCAHTNINPQWCSFDMTYLTFLS